MSMEIKAPWLKFYGDVPHTLDYPKTTMFEEVEKLSKQYPDYIAYDFMGKKTTYKQAVLEAIQKEKEKHE